MKVSRSIFISLIISLPIGCTTLERSSDSGYSRATTHSTESGWKKISSNEDHRPRSYEPMTDTMLRLKQLENAISGRRELEQYSKALPWFKDDQEKIQFLEISGYEQRAQWLLSQDFPGRAKKVATQMQEVVEAQDIALGMPENLVKKSWGEPSTIDVSGSPQFHNQRWHYQKFVPSQEGFKSENKTIYFEGGKVVGWETDSL